MQTEIIRLYASKRHNFIFFPLMKQVWKPFKIFDDGWTEMTWSKFHNFLQFFYAEFRRFYLRESMKKWLSGLQINKLHIFDKAIFVCKHLFMHPLLYESSQPSTISFFAESWKFGACLKWVSNWWRCELILKAILKTRLRKSADMRTRIYFNRATAWPNLKFINLMILLQNSILGLNSLVFNCTNSRTV